MNYYIADTHFGHKNIFEIETDRPGKDLKEMQEEMIKRWNNKVTDEDYIYILGDFAFKGKYLSFDDIIDLLHRLNGNKILIIGNHDNNYIEKLKCYGIVAISDIYETYDNGDYVVMCHYPMEIWDHKHHGSIHLHGHTHNSRNEDLKMKNRYNVGCMWFNYEPVTLQEIKDFWKEYKND